MSTRVCPAYKIRRAAHFWPVVHDVLTEGRKQVQAKLVEIYQTFADNVKTEGEHYQKKLGWYSPDWDPDTADKLARLSIADEVISQGYKDTSTDLRRSPFDFDVNVVFYPYKGAVYLRPFCDMQMRGVLDFLKEDKRLREFKYWTNTDRPDHLSERQWRERAQVWDAIFKHPPHLDLVTADICAWGAFWELSPLHDMMRAVAKKGTRAPKDPVRMKEQAQQLKEGLDKLLVQRQAHREVIAEALSRDPTTVNH